MSFMFSLCLLALSLLLSGTSAMPSIDSFETRHADLVLSEREIAPDTVPAVNLIVESSQVYCNGERYRTNLVGASCFDAVGQIPLQQEKLRFRNRPGGVYDIGLPYRFISGGFLMRP